MRPLRSGARPSAPPAMRVTRQYIRPPVGRTGAQKRKQRGVRAGVEKCACGQVLEARRGWLRCPVHGNG